MYVTAFGTADFLALHIADSRAGDADGFSNAAGAVDRNARALYASRDADALFAEIDTNTGCNFEALAKSKAHKYPPHFINPVFNKLYHI